MAEPGSGVKTARHEARKTAPGTTENRDLITDASGSLTVYSGDNVKKRRRPTTRIAHCSCGALRAEVTGEPPRVAICHCIECQRRTGSAFGSVAFFPKDQVRIEGPSKVYVRRSAAGRKVEFHFCPACGASVFWYAEFRPDQIGIAVGAFADPSMAWPAASVWEATRHPWVTFDHPIERFTDQGLTPVMPATKSET